MIYGVAAIRTLNKSFGITTKPNKILKGIKINATNDLKIMLKILVKKTNQIKKMAISMYTSMLKK
tara:strand:- start:508 stop:702 length:195 start_codon:yes stop_codon:yes gene_type:complete